MNDSLDNDLAFAVHRTCLRVPLGAPHSALIAHPSRARLKDQEKQYICRMFGKMRQKRIYVASEKRTKSGGQGLRNFTYGVSYTKLHTRNLQKHRWNARSKKKL